MKTDIPGPNSEKLIKKLERFQVRVVRSLLLLNSIITLEKKFQPLIFFLNLYTFDSYSLVIITLLKK